MIDLFYWILENLLLVGVITGGFLVGAIATVYMQRRKKTAPSRDTQQPAIVNPQLGVTAPVVSPTMPASSARSATVTKTAPPEVSSFQPGINKEHAQQLLAMLTGSPPRHATSFFYLVALLFMAICMVVLPCIYLALVGASAYGVYWYATSFSNILHDPQFGTRAKLFLYFAPLIGGSVVALFMVKPLLARSVKADAPISLRREEEPVLFAFVDRLCQLLGTAAPRRIDVDCQANASASLRYGLWSIFLPADLVLTIGLPLASGMNLRQFSGVLAHEFGHFAQGAGMRLSQIIWTVNIWFARVVYQRDSWDAALVALTKGLPIQVAPLFWPAHIGIWVSRGILWLLMYLGFVISSFMSRQQEFAADRYGAFLAGSDEFQKTSKKMLELNMAAQGAHGDLARGFGKFTLPRNFPELCLHNVPQIPDYALQNADSAMRHAKTGLFDTHPSTGDRIAAAESLELKATFNPPDVPASVLFRNFEKHCRDATLSYYRQIVGNAIQKEQLFPNETFLDTIAKMPARG
ncbi:MAG: M48 family metallopeptidase [Candidatus Sumerlaeaceae bacterium]